MNSRWFLSSPFFRNLAGVIVLMLAWYLPDRFFFSQRTGLEKVFPYIMLLTMYGWIVLHNRLLVERLYLAGKRRQYFLWAVSAMVIGSLNIFLTMHFLFPGTDPLQQIVGFWVFTIAGAGIYLFLRPPDVKPLNATPLKEISNFEFTADDRRHSLPLTSIVYIESLENYIRVITDGKTHLVRMSLKQAEQMLSPVFIRISRSHLVNRNRIELLKETEVVISGKELKIGKVYKKYVSESMSLML